MSNSHDHRDNTSGAVQADPHGIRYLKYDQECRLDGDLHSRNHYDCPKYQDNGHYSRNSGRSSYFVRYPP